MSCTEPLTSTPLNNSGMNWNTDCTPSILIEYQCLTSVMLLRPSGHIPKFCWKSSQKSGGCYKSKDQLHINSHGFKNGLFLEELWVLVRWPHTFGLMMITPRVKAIELNLAYGVYWIDLSQQSNERRLLKMWFTHGEVVTLLCLEMMLQFPARLLQQFELKSFFRAHKITE